MTTIAPRAVPVSQVISPAPRSQWEALVAADPTSLTDQSPAWMDVLVESGGYVDASRLYVLDDGRRFVLPLARRTGPAGAGGVELSFPDGWGIGGLVGPGRDVDAIRAVLAELTYRGRLLTRIRPDPLDGDLWEEAAGPDVVRRAKRAHVIDLTVGTDALRAGLHKSTRRNLVKGERAGLRVTDTATEAHLAAYYRLYLLSLERWAERSREPQWLARWRGVRRDPLSKLATMADRLGDGFRLWLAWEDGHADRRVDRPAGQHRPRHPGRHRPRPGGTHPGRRSCSSGSPSRRPWPTGAGATTSVRRGRRPPWPPSRRASAAGLCPTPTSASSGCRSPVPTAPCAPASSG